MSKRSLLYILSFAAGGFLLALWDMELNLDPLPWAGLRDLLRAACFEIPLILWFGGPTARTLLLWPLTTAGIYAAVGCVLGRALRRQPSKVQGPRVHRPVGRLVLYFAAFGYLVVLWNDGLDLAPLSWEFARGIFRNACFVCFSDTHGTAWGDLLFGAPVNAAIYAGLGWLIGSAFRRAPVGRPGAGSRL